MKLQDVSYEVEDMRVGLATKGVEKGMSSKTMALYNETLQLVEQWPMQLPLNYEERFWHIVEQANMSLMEDKDNFYGYFFLQMGKEINFNLASPTGVNFKGAHYVMYFNPLLFLPLTPEQMEGCIKHEILHVVSLHMWRAKKLNLQYSTLAVNLAMDIVVNTYVEHLHPDAMDLKRVNDMYGLLLAPYKTFEYYVEAIQTGLDEIKRKAEDDGAADKPFEYSESDNAIKMGFDPKSTHDIWMESDTIDDQIFQKLTEKHIREAQRGELSSYLENLIAALKSEQDALPWYMYLKKLIGSVAYGRKRTTMRRHRRQPERLDLRGELRNHKAKIVVALDISGSISDAEFEQAMQEVFQIVHIYDFEITVVECDNVIRRHYIVKRMKDLQPRLAIRGNTAFTPVIDFCNDKDIDLLIYFTDGKGEERLLVYPQGYHVMWVLTGHSEGLSLRNGYGLIKKLNPVKTQILEDDVYERTEGFSMNNQERTTVF